MLREFLSKPDGIDRVMIDMTCVEAIMEHRDFTTIVTRSDTYNVVQNYDTVRLAWEASERNRKQRRSKKNA